MLMTQREGKKTGDCTRAGITAHPSPAGRYRQHGGMISLLLALVAVGLLMYFMLRHREGPASGTDVGNAVHCEPLIDKLVQSTGGVGAQAQAAYDRLPAECKKLLPNPASLTPSPERSADIPPEAQ
jgi:hypothetical protein